MSKTYGKQEIIEDVAKGSKLSKVQAKEAVESFLGSIEKQLKKGGRVQLTGFGTFSVFKRKAREGRNPKTGDTIKIPAKRTPKFSAGKSLKDAVK